MSATESVTAGQFLRTVSVMPVSDIAQAAEWYERALGFKTIYIHEDLDDNDPDNYAILQRDGVQVHLILDEPPPHRRAWTRAGVGYLYLLVRDIAEVYQSVRSQGVAIARELRVETWGAEAFELQDPSGNTVHVEAGRS